MKEFSVRPEPFGYAQESVPQALGILARKPLRIAFSLHQRADIRQAMLEAGHMLAYLPTYSPDLNPIEHQWAQSKAVRKQTNCTVSELFAGGAL